MPQGVLEPKKPWEARIEPRRPWGAKIGTGCPRRPNCSPGGLLRQEISPGGPRSSESSPRGPSTLIYVPFSRTPPNPDEVARKNNALRKKWPEGYIAKENQPKGVLVRKLIFLQPLRPKGYMAKARNHYKTRLILKSSSFSSEGYIHKGPFRKGISTKNFRTVYS